MGTPHDRKHRKHPSPALVRGAWFSLALLLIALGYLFSGKSPRVPETPRIDTTGKLVMSVIDVGQGDSVLVEFPNRQCMLVDAGDLEHGQVVVNYLRQRKIRTIDLLVATHPHEDHIGGMADVLGAFTVSRVWDSGYAHGSATQAQFLRTVKRRQIPFGTPTRGTTREFAGVKIEVLAPVKRISSTDSDANNNSLVLRISYGSISFLLTGDMEEAERHSISSWPVTSVLKVAHHGSHNGTDAAFLRAVRPELAVISCARKNDSGHPHAETMAAFRTAGVSVKQTALSGTVVIATDGKTLTLQGKKVVPTAVAPAQKYIGNLHSKTFHLPSCASLPAEQNRHYFATRNAAISAGYHPCGRCKP